ncbi:DNA alkylation repair protein [Bacillus sp. 31A1R]|uniref:DNA alkylation repair protein n=1 Tax=Robertmurraya mangrovi TaxID=3098077 RepID=A0ABU5IVY0_9BACI|nr:DNA alkylation repair protein [Bacillus sp. 31A1R]MDZ5471296.1 DNA alkylation repair protein [Bacillus sp. 31A1R]
MKYSEKLRQTYMLFANPANAVPMKKYMRDQFEFFGIKTPERRAILKDFVKEHGLPKKEEFHEVILELWAMPERELQIVAIGLIDFKQKKKELKDEFVPLLEKMITLKSWWDTVDHIASNHVGYLFNHYPAFIHTVGLKWRNSDNIWLRRTMILFQLKYKTNTDTELLAEIIVENLGSKEFFINKAIGWVLREYAKTNPFWVKEFVEKHPLSLLSKREALKHIK